MKRMPKSQSLVAETVMGTREAPAAVVSYYDLTRITQKKNVADMSLEE